MHQLLRRDVDSAAWETLHPKSLGAGPQSLKELRPIRAELERVQENLLALRFKLASALFQVCRLAPSRYWSRHVPIAAAAD